jgi:hypothetical protein
VLDHRGVVGAVACIVALTACAGSAQPRRTITRFVDPPAASSSSTPTAPSTSGAPSSLPPAPSSMKQLSGRCDGKLPLHLVAPAIDETLPGRTEFIVGQPDPSIHRVTYINCKYGLASQASTPTVEIQVSLYGTAGQAAARIAPTVKDYENNGATAKTVQVGQASARVLTGGSGTGYDTATLVMAYGQRTVAVSLSNDIAANKQESDLTTLAALAVKRTQ